MIGIIIGTCAGILLLFVIWWISASNGIKRLDLKCKEALSDIDVALVKRHDTLSKLLDVVKGYKQHEAETLSNIVSLRNGMSMAERNTANKQMNELFGRINVIAENYPELRSNTNFINLQQAISDTEEHLQAARRLYNANVNAYNQKLVVFPSSIVAGSMGAIQKSFFEADAASRQDVKMEF